jgi:bifunctional DNA-binding transcriptional regulator/antitoxin component of YhaV-PrlF toxin-antitoxin module
VSPKGQVTIPGLLRARYGFPPGTKVVWLEREGDLIPKPLLSVDQLAGRYRPVTGRLSDALVAERTLDREREDG